MRLYLSHKDQPLARWEIVHFDPTNHNMILRGGHSMQQLIMRMADLKTAGYVVAQEEGTRELYYHPESDSYAEDINGEFSSTRNRDPLLEDVTGIFDHEVQHFLRGLEVKELRAETGAVFDVITDEVLAQAAAVAEAVVAGNAGLAALRAMAETDEG